MNQSKNKKQQHAPQELRQFLLAELEASKQMIEVLNDEQLEEVVGGLSPTGEQFKAWMNYEGSPISLESFLRLPQPNKTPSPITPHSENETVLHSPRPGNRPLYIIEQKLPQPTLRRSISAHF